MSVSTNYACYCNCFNKFSTCFDHVDVSYLEDKCHYCRTGTYLANSSTSDTCTSVPN